jgi:hypothetical protein
MHHRLWQVGRPRLYTIIETDFLLYTSGRNGRVRPNVLEKNQAAMQLHM